MPRAILAGVRTDGAPRTLLRASDGPAVRSQLSSRPSSSGTMSAATATRSSPLAQTLLDRFGHEGFRRGQREAVEAIVQEQRDVAVFWATGGGKSLCYQLPALHAFDGSKAGLPPRAQGIVVVVSPLISLMQDQVRALNATVRKDGEEDIACFLGSSQPDPNVLSRALAGMYALVYVSPEKLLSFGLMDELIQRQTRVLAFAIDEAHCICEWGADFRREYAQLGKIREVFPNTPIMALTATASPRVRADIVEKLKLRAPLTCKGSFDRPNLEIAVKSRPALARAANEIAADFRKRPGPSIIYCATRKLVEEMAAALGSELGPDDVRKYHAGLSDGERSEAHGLFITGQASIVVATVAFGMGIDKPDVRRVIHYGPPKTMEAYVQQIGRAGRDGLPSQCVLYFQEQDFINYGSDFYVSGLSPEQRQAVEASTQKLRNFSRRLQCRRYQLLKAFDEEDPSWGTECGTCDVCRMPSKKLVKRDYTEPARLLMSKIYSSGSAWTHIQKRIEPGAVKGWSMPKLRKLLDMLAAEGFVGAEECKVKLQNGFNNTYVKYSLLPAGRAVLQTQDPVLLTPSMFLLDLEKEDAMVHNKRYDEIRALGLNPDLIPTDQILAGKGPVYDAFLHWTRTLKRYEETGKLDTVRRLQDMKAVIEEWRRLEAVRTGTSPATVIPDYVVCKVAYTRPTSVDALRSAGVRSANIGDLAKAIEAASARLGFDVKRTAQSAGMDDDDEEVVVFPEGPFSPPKRWRLANSADERKAWFATCLALQEGDTLVNIALNGGKKPRQVATIAGHALTGIQHGLKLGKLDLRTLARERDVQRLTKSDWTDLNAFAIASGMDPAGQEDLPSDFKSKFARHVLGDDLVDKAFQDRTPEEKARMSSFYAKLDLWMTLRRVGFEPSFAPAREANKKSKCL